MVVLLAAVVGGCEYDYGYECRGRVLSADGTTPVAGAYVVVRVPVVMKYRSGRMEEVFPDAPPDATNKRSVARTDSRGFFKFDCVGCCRAPLFAPASPEVEHVDEWVQVEGMEWWWRVRITLNADMQRVGWPGHRRIDLPAVLVTNDPKEPLRVRQD